MADPKTSGEIKITPDDIKQYGDSFVTNAGVIKALGEKDGSLNSALSDCEGAAYEALVNRLKQVSQAADNIHQGLSTYADNLNNAAVSFEGVDASISHKYGSDAGDNFKGEGGSNITRGRHHDRSTDISVDENGVSVDNKDNYNRKNGEGEYQESRSSNTTVNNNGVSHSESRSASHTPRQKKGK